MANWRLGGDLIETIIKKYQIISNPGETETPKIDTCVRGSDSKEKKM